MDLYQYTEFTVHDAVLLLSGLGWTLFVFAVSYGLGAVLGFIGGLVRHRRVPVLAPLVGAGVEVFRNSPLLVQLFLVYYGLPVFVGWHLSPLTAAVLTLSVNTGAFLTVIVLAGLDAVPVGQWQAASAAGMNYRQIMRCVVLPQAFRHMIPPALSLAVGQLQVTALVSLINVIDLTKVGGILNTRTLRPFAVWPVVALLYFALAKPMAMAAARLEHRFRLRGAWTHEAH